MNAETLTETLKTEIAPTKINVGEHPEMAWKIDFRNNGVGNKQPIFYGGKERFREFLNRNGYDDENKKAFSSLVNWACSVPPSAKGLYIHGKPGTGKTMFVDVMRRSGRMTYSGNDCHIENYRSFPIYSCKTIVGLWKSNKDRLYQIIGQKDVSFDDLGTEEKVNDYGSMNEVMAHVIDERWTIFTRYGGLTIITSNIPNIAKEGCESIKDRYGVRTQDRIRGMCWQMKIEGESRR
jgi:hypothetical protein